MTETANPMPPQFRAAFDLMRRTGVNEVQVRWSDDEEPTVWFVVAKYSDGRFETAAAGNPTTAALRLCGRLVDGGQCLHCKRMTVFEPDMDALNDVYKLVGACCYQWDPELNTFRRDCEGDEN
jgi:hypothetical protein